MKKIEHQKQAAKKAYIEAKKQYLQNMSRENWVKFCNCKSDCMRAGVII